MTPRPYPRRLALAIVAFNAISLFSVGIEPIIAAQLGADLGLPEHQAGAILSAEFGGSIVATFPALAWARRIPARWVTLVAALLFLATNLASARYLAYGSLLALRALTGLAEGTLLILTLTIAARAPHPTRLYGWWVIGQTVVAAAGLLFFPQLSARFGLAAIYTAMGLGILLTLPLAWCFSASEPAVIGDAGRPSLPWRNATAVLTVLFLYYVVAGGMWGFAADRGTELHLPPQTVGYLLGTAYLVSLGGAGLAARVGTPPRCKELAVLGHVGLGLALVPFALAGGSGSFALFAILLQFAWAFSAPLLMTLVAEVEPVGSFMSAATFVMGAGLTVGPFVAGYLFEARSGPTVLSLCFAVVVAASAVLLRTHRTIIAAVPSNDG
jgi:MFS transporter, DHA1 family, inner membrane transport protein